MDSDVNVYLAAMFQKEYRGKYGIYRPAKIYKDSERYNLSNSRAESKKYKAARYKKHCGDDLGGKNQIVRFYKCPRPLKTSLYNEAGDRAGRVDNFRQHHVRGFINPVDGDCGEASNGQKHRIVDFYERSLLMPYPEMIEGSV